MTCIWCKVHESNSEGFIARCYYSLWANALERCDLIEADVTLKPLVTWGPDHPSFDEMGQ